MNLPEDASDHDKGHLALFGICPRFAQNGDRNLARLHRDWQKDRVELLRLGAAGTQATLRAIDLPDDEAAERLMHQLADAVMTITEKYIENFHEEFREDYFEILADADLESEFEPFD